MYICECKYKKIRKNVSKMQLIFNLLTFSILFEFCIMNISFLQKQNCVLIKDASEKGPVYYRPSQVDNQCEVIIFGI